MLPNCDYLLRNQVRKLGNEWNKLEQRKLNLDHEKLQWAHSWFF